MHFFISWIQIFLITVLALILWTTNESQAANCGREAGFRHPNGGGFVANTAEVSASVFVSADSVICGHAKVEGDVKIIAQSRIFQRPHISGLSGPVLIMAGSEVSGHAQISGPSTLFNSRATDHTRVFGDVRLVNSQVVDYGQAFGKGYIKDKFISGHVKYNAQTCSDALK